MIRLLVPRLHGTRLLGGPRTDGQSREGQGRLPQPASHYYLRLPHPQTGYAFLLSCSFPHLLSCVTGSLLNRLALWLLPELHFSMLLQTLNLSLQKGFLFGS